MSTPDAGRNGQIRDEGPVVRIDFALRHRPEDVEANRGRYVAWSYDGERLLASGATLGELYDELTLRNIDERVIDYIYSENDSFI